MDGIKQREDDVFEVIKTREIAIKMRIAFQKA